MPAAVIAIVVVLVLAGFTIALINLSSEANRGAAASGHPGAVTTGATQH